jgi:hypothetical protein
MIYDAVSLNADLIQQAVHEALATHDLIDLDELSGLWACSIFQAQACDKGSIQMLAAGDEYLRPRHIGRIR